MCDNAETKSKTIRALSSNGPSSVIVLVFKEVIGLQQAIAIVAYCNSAKDEVVIGAVLAEKSKWSVHLLDLANEVPKKRAALWYFGVKRILDYELEVCCRRKMTLGQRDTASTNFIFEGFCVALPRIGKSNQYTFICGDGRKYNNERKLSVL